MTPEQQFRHLLRVRDMTFTEGYDAGAQDFEDGVPPPRRGIRSNAAPGFKGYDAGYFDARDRAGYSEDKQAEWIHD